ncbi:MAG: SLC13 family permease [Deltaproteobacteria bacterium]
MDVRNFVLLIFVVCYALFVVFPGRRPWVAAGGALLVVASGALSFGQAVAAVNWNVMGIFVGTLAVADVFMESRVPAYLAEVLVNRARSSAWAILLVCLMTGLISAFVENVATVLIVAPIALTLARKLDIHPAPMMISIAVSSNLQGAATLIGDPPSMLLAGFARMNFVDFFFYKGRPGIFFAVELGALAALVVLYLVFRGHRGRVTLVASERVVSWFPTVLLVVLIGLLACSSLIDRDFAYLAGLLCVAAGIVSLLWAKVRFRKPLFPGIRSLDWETAVFLAAVFILVGSLTASGWIEVIANGLADAVKGNAFLGYTLLVVLAMLASAFVDNVPFLAAMLPVGLIMGERLSLPPQLFLFGLLIGASLGGNITPIGASANIVACGILKKHGHAVSFREFMRIGVPFTLAAVAAAYLFGWLVWSR